MMRLLLWISAHRVASSDAARDAAKGTAAAARRTLPKIARKAGEASRVVAPPGGAEEMGRNLGRAVGRTLKRINRAGRTDR